MMKQLKKAIIPVAGFGTRMLPATKSIPKEMLPIVDRPLIHYAVQEAIESGIEQIILITSRGKDAIEDYFDHAPELELSLHNQADKLNQTVADILQPGQIVYIRQQQALGLGHAVWCARHLIQPDEAFAVLLPDDLIVGYQGSCLKQMVERYRSGSLIATMEVPRALVSRYGIVVPGENAAHGLLEIKDLIEKPQPEQAPSLIAVVGRYILEGSIFSTLDQAVAARLRGTHSAEVQLTDALRPFAAAGKLCGYQFKGKRFDCGAKEEYVLANVTMALRNGTITLPQLVALAEPK